MKTKFIILIGIFLIFQNSLLKAQEIFFDSKNIQIQDEGNMILSKKGIAKIPSENILIEGDKSIYDKKNSELVVIGNVKFFDNLNNVYIESEKAVYNEIENTLFSSGSTFVKVENEYELYSGDLLYNRNSMKITTISESSVFDNQDNNIKDDDKDNPIKQDTTTTTSPSSSFNVIGQWVFNTVQSGGINIEGSNIRSDNHLEGDSLNCDIHSIIFISNRGNCWSLFCNALKSGSHFRKIWLGNG